MANTFPRWTNTLPLKLLVCIAFIGLGVSAGVAYYFTQSYTRVGYQPSQPIPFSHQIHAGQLGMDCRYCHSFVEQSGAANVPSSDTCYRCHQHVLPNSPLLEPLRESVATGKPLEWVKVHKTPDYAYFNHSVHVDSGVSCVSCHGKINEMPVVFHHESQSMSWCLDCHREPEKHLRPLDKVTDLNWTAKSAGLDQTEMGLKLKQAWQIEPPTNCAGCHR
ncbi:MAG: cytochrome c3 family protein [Verrucomicrobiota bacterium]